MKREQMKQKAVEILKEMGVYSPYIEAFEKNDVVQCLKDMQVFGLINTQNCKRKSKTLSRNTNAQFTPLLTNFSSSANAILSLSLLTINTNGKRLLKKKTKTFTPTLTSGIKTTTGAQNLEL